MGNLDDSKVELLGFILFGCGEVPNSTGVKEEEILNDADRDSCFVWENCDENDAQINPSATKIFDGLDNDCDIPVDEDYDILVDNDGGEFGDDAIGYCLVILINYATERIINCRTK